MVGEIIRPCPLVATDYFREPFRARPRAASCSFTCRGPTGLAQTAPSLLPAGNSRALYQVNDNKGPSTPIDSIRIVMLTSEYNHLFDNTNVMSNQDVGATIIYNNSEVFYDVGPRLKGSPRITAQSRRVGVATRSSFALINFFAAFMTNLARRVGLQSLPDSQYEILVKQLLNHAGGGLASNYDDLELFDRS